MTVVERIARAAAQAGLPLAVFCGLLLLYPGAVTAAPGDLDRSFGPGGVVDATAQLGGGMGVPREVDMTLGPHNEVFVLSVVVRYCNEQRQWCTVVRVIKYAPDGELDSSFDLSAAFAGSSPNPESLAIAADPDGRIVVAAGGDDGIAVVRRNPDGSADPTFGAGGAAIIGVKAAVRDIGVDRSGAIVVLGEAASGEGQLLVARLRQDGAPDPDFGGSGVRLLDLVSSPRVDGLALVDSEILIGLSEQRCCADGEPRLIRLAPDGRVLEVFGVWPQRRPVPLIGVAAIVAKPRGGVQVVTEGANGTFLSNYFWNRGPDLGSGKPRLGFLAGFSAGRPVAAATDAWGMVSLAGSVQGNDLSGNGSGIARLAVTRLRADGRLDRTFGAGWPQFPQFSSDSAVSRGVVSQSDGRIVVLGAWYPECARACPHDPRFALIRYRGGRSSARCRGRRATVVGTRRSERIFGTPHRDVIAGLGGDDEVLGRDGNDLICGGPGNDDLRGGGGRDRIFGGPGKNIQTQQ